MDLLRKLDKILSIRTIREASESSVFNRNEWMSADSDKLGTVAFTNSKNSFWNALKSIATDFDDKGLLDVINRRDHPQYSSIINDLMRTARKEARIYAQERGATAQSRTPEAVRAGPLIGGSKTPLRVRQGAGRPDWLGKSKEEIEDYYRKRREEAGKKPHKEQPGDKLFGIWDKTQGDWVRDDSGHIISDVSSDQLTASVLGDPEKFQDPDNYEIKGYDNPRSLTTLRNVKKPLEQGWTTEEVVEAMMPWIRSIAWRFHSNKTPIDDLIQHGAIAVMHALRTDKGEAPFGTYAWKRIYAEISRASLTGGVVKGGEREDDEERAARAKLGLSKPGNFGERGPVIGYDVYWRSADGEMQKKHFPSEIKGYEQTHSDTGRAPARTNDPGFVAAKKYAGEMRGKGVLAAVRELRSKMVSTATKMKGGDDEQELGSTLKGTKVRSPAIIAMHKDLLHKLMSTANLSDKERQTIDLMFGLDVPEAGSGGPKMRAYEPHEPGEQTGLSAYGDSEKDIRRSGAGKAAKITDPKTGMTHDVLEIERSPADISALLGVSNERIRQLAGRAITKLKLARRNMKDLRRDVPTPKAEVDIDKTLDYLKDVLASEVSESILIRDTINILFKLHSTAMNMLDEYATKMVKGIITESEQKGTNGLIELEDCLRQYIISTIISGEANIAFD